MGGKRHVPRPGSIVCRRQKKRRRRLGAIRLPIERSPSGKRSQRAPRKARSGTVETPARTPHLSRRGTTTARPPPGIMQQKSAAVGNPRMIADWSHLRAGNHASSPSRRFCRQCSGSLRTVWRRASTGFNASVAQTVAMLLAFRKQVFNPRLRISYAQDSIEGDHSWLIQKPCS
jgi:hypothetical protein